MLLLFCIYLFVLGNAKQITNEHLRRGYVPHRSSNIHATGELVAGDDNLILLGGNLKGKADTIIDVTDIGDALVRSFWLNKFKMENPIEISSNLPQANLLLANFGMDLTEFNQLPNHDVFSSLTQNKLDVDFFPADEVATITSLLTGRNPEDHGIAGATFGEKERVSAFSSNSRSTRTLGVMDLLKTKLPEASVVAGCGSGLVSTALTQNLYQSASMDNFEEFKSQDPRFSFNFKDLPEQFNIQPVWLSVQQEVQSLNFNNDGIKTFLMEMEYLNRVAQSFQAEQGKVHFYSLSTISMENVSGHEGCLTIFNAVVGNLLQQFQQTYEQHNVQLAFMKSPKIEETEHLEHMLAAIKEPALGRRILGQEEFDIVCGVEGVVCYGQRPTLGANETEGDQWRTYAIGSWFFLVFTIIILVFSSYFATLRYDNDSTLFSRYNFSDM